MTKALKSITIDVSKLPSVVKSCIKTGVNLLIFGPKGCGKSEIVDQVCDALDMPLFKHRLADCEAADLRGLGIPKTDCALPTMIFTRPDDIPPSEGKCVWFLDELNRANRSTMNSIMQATDSNKRVGCHKLSKDCVVIAAGNPSSDESYDVSVLDSALADRFLHVHVEYSTTAAINYAKQKQRNASVISFMNMNKSKLFTGKTEAGEASCTPRSLERLSKIMPVLACLERDSMLALVQGCIGTTLGHEFYSFITENRPVMFAELVEKEGKKRLLAMTSEEGYRADLINLTIDDVAETFAGNKPVSDECARTVEFLLTNIQAEHACSALLLLSTKCKQVLLHPIISTSQKLVDSLAHLDKG